MTTITANDVKTRGTALFNKAVARGEEVVITSHGKPRYVVMDIEHYSRLRDLELEQAVKESRKDIAEGRYHADKIASHIKRITKRSA